MPPDKYHVGQVFKEPGEMPDRPNKFDGAYWARLAVTCIFATVGAAFGAGAAIANNSSHFLIIETRVAAIESAKPQETSWQVQQNQIAIAVMQRAKEKSDADVGSINQHLATMDANIAELKDAVKSRKNQ